MNTGVMKSLCIDSASQFYLAWVLFILFLMDVLNGSTIQIYQLSGPQSLADQLLPFATMFAVFILIVKGVKNRRINKWVLVIIVPMILSSLVEDQIVSYQYDLTMTNLENLCEAIEQYKDAVGVYPNEIADLTPDYLSGNPISGFGLINSEMQYRLSDSLET